VIVVAIEGSIRDWAAYIGAVPGQNHEREWQLVLEDGSKLFQKFAEVLFPDFAQDFVWRD